MWAYYRDSAICYAYIEDFSIVDSPAKHGTAKENMSDFSRSRWFTRGWTLQELIASPEVIFYDVDWAPIGSRSDSSLLQSIHDITKIPKLVLENGPHVNFSGYSIAARMSWAAQRKCTRVEDEAYSLLGIFDVNMPMLYGGERSRN